MVKFLLTVSFLIAYITSFAQEKPEAKDYLYAFDVNGPVRYIELIEGDVPSYMSFDRNGELSSFWNSECEYKFQNIQEGSVSVYSDVESISINIDRDLNHINDIRSDLPDAGMSVIQRYNYNNDGLLKCIYIEIIDEEHIKKDTLDVSIICTDHHGNWIERIVGENIEKRNIFYFDECARIPFGESLNRTFNVEGVPNIENFVKAVEPATGTLDDIDPLVDKPNGYFSYFVEGAGGFEVNMCYWNRNDGKKLFIISYRIGEEIYEEDEKKRSLQNSHYCNEWFYFDSKIEADNDGWGMLNEFGHKAYVFDTDISRLIPLEHSPFNDVPDYDVPCFYELPQQGKDIKVRLGMNDIEGYGTLIWNGMTFDYKQ